MSKILVCGAGGFIGSHLVKELKRRGNKVYGADLKYPQFSETMANEFFIGDLTEQTFVKDVMRVGFDEIYQLAADMGGAGYIFSGKNDASIMYNSAMINLNMLDQACKTQVKKMFFSSSACVYPQYNQLDPNNPRCDEASAYPAQPDSEYGWEKLFSERVYLAFKKQFGINVKIARYHNIFGEEGAFEGGREKAPSALCRKVALASDGDDVEVWGSGNQTRSFLYIDECIEGTIRLMESKCSGPFNIGSDEMVSIKKLAQLIIDISGKDIGIKQVPGLEGVQGRNSDNDLISRDLKWSPTMKLADGLKRTYRWIEDQVVKQRGSTRKRAA